MSHLHTTTGRAGADSHCRGLLRVKHSVHGRCIAVPPARCSVWRKFAAGHPAGSKQLSYRHTVGIPASAGSNQTYAAPPSTSINLQDKEQLDRLWQLCRLGAGKATASAIAQHGLQLVTTSSIYDTGAVLLTSSIFEDGEIGDGMSVPLNDVKRDRSLAGDVGFQSEWQPVIDTNKMVGLGAEVSRNYASSLEQLFAERDYQVTAQDYRSLDDTSSDSENLPNAEGYRVPDTAPNSLMVQLGRIGKAAAQAASPITDSLRKPINRAAALGQAAVKGAAAVIPQAVAGTPSSLDGAASKPRSSWLAVDDIVTHTRTFSVEAPPELTRVATQQVNSNLCTFEGYSLGVRINRQVYSEASALYATLMPLVMDYLEEQPNGRVCFTGEGAGGSLAIVVALMLVSRGMTRSRLLPVIAFNAPPVLGEVPDYNLWCNAEACVGDTDEMIEEVMSRGLLSELGLPLDAIKNVVVPNGNGATPLGGGIDSSQQHIMDVLTSWWARGMTGAGLAGPPAKPAGAMSADSLSSAHVVHADDPRRVSVFRPIGQVIMYQPSCRRDAGAGSSGSSGGSGSGNSSSRMGSLNEPIRM